MTAWTEQDLTRIGGAEELQLASRRPDGTLRSYVTIWVIRARNDLYVRSAYGSDNPWFRRARASGAGRIRAAGIERDVTFTDPGSDSHADIDRAYHAKYDRYGPAIVGSVTGGKAAPVTIRLCRAEEEGTRSIRQRPLGRRGFRQQPVPRHDDVRRLGTRDHDLSASIIHRALDAGINFVDTADVYSHGESEVIVDKTLLGRRDDIVLATKFFMPFDDDPNHRGASRRVGAGPDLQGGARGRRRRSSGAGGARAIARVERGGVVSAGRCQLVWGGHRPRR